MKNPVTGGWRLVFQLDNGKANPIRLMLETEQVQPIELRAFLRSGEDTLTETWSYTYRP